MARRYEQAPKTTRTHVDRALSRYHPHLKAAEVTLNVLHAYGPRDEETGTLTAPAIEARGQKALACIKVTNLKDRAAGLADAVLMIDGDDCGEWDDEKWDAIVDHELMHLDLQDSTDDLGRPKIKTRHHDYEVGGFWGVGERHKQASVEVQSIQSIGSNLVKQGVLEGF
jgi:hypothetical protein